MDLLILAPLMALLAAPDAHSTHGGQATPEPSGAGADTSVPHADQPTMCLSQAAPTGELAPWTQPGRLVAAVNAAQLQLGLEPGRAATVRLVQVKHVTYLARPEKPGLAISYGGLVPFEITRPGTYRIALAVPAWIDVVRQGRIVPSSVHGHGPACTGIRKIVDFRLTPGRYTLQLGGSNSAEVRVLFVRSPG